MVKDNRGVFRGACRDCGADSCPEYEKPLVGNCCDYCGCKPGKHLLGGSSQAAKSKPVVCVPLPHQLSQSESERDDSRAGPVPFDGQREWQMSQQPMPTNAEVGDEHKEGKENPASKTQENATDGPTAKDITDGLLGQGSGSRGDNTTSDENAGRAEGPTDAEGGKVDSSADEAKQEETEDESRRLSLLAKIRSDRESRQSQRHLTSDSQGFDSQGGESMVIAIESNSILRRIRRLKRQLHSLPVIMPESSFRMRWDTLIMVLVSYYAITVPLYMGFVMDDPVAVIVIDWIAWAVFVVDIFLNFNTAFKEDGVMKTSRRSIAKDYMRFWFWIDFVACLPLDAFINEGSNADDNKSSFAQLNKLARLLRVFKLFRVFRAVRVLRRFEDFAKFNPSMLRIFKILLLLLIFWHWTACMYWLFCWLEDFAFGLPYFQKRDGSNRWVPPEELWCTDVKKCPDLEFTTRFTACAEDNVTNTLYNCPVDVGDQYVFAFFWAVMVTTGIGRDIEPVTPLQHIFSIIWIILGVIMYAVFIGAASSALQNLDAGTAERREKLENITRYMRQRNVPKDLQKRIKDYYEYMWSSHQSLNADGGVMNDLHHSLTLELNIILNRKLIENIPMFRVITNTDCLIDMIEKLTPKIYIPGEYIVLEGEEGDEMYIMLRGLVHVLVGKTAKEHVATLKEGDVFGERALITRERRNASVRAATHCDLLVLSKEDFDEVMRQYPEFFHSLQRIARLHAKQGWGRVRETIKMTRAIRHFGGQVNLRSLLTASLEEAIGDVTSSNEAGLTKHIEAVKPQQRLTQVLAGKDAGSDRSFLRKNRRRQSVAEAGGTVGDFLRDNAQKRSHRSSDPTGLMAAGGGAGRPRQRATTINAGASREPR